jgi:hypothetical protein
MPGSGQALDEELAFGWGRAEGQRGLVGVAGLCGAPQLAQPGGPWATGGSAVAACPSRDQQGLGAHAHRSAGVREDRGCQPGAARRDVALCVQAD